MIADPAQQPRWDGNDNLSEAPAGQRVHAVGDVFSMTLTQQAVRENHVVEFEEGRLIAWMPAEPGGAPIGQLWRWELEPLDDDAQTRVTHTYDWSKLNDPKRFERARSTTEESFGPLTGPAREPRRNGRIGAKGRVDGTFVDSASARLSPGIVTGLR